MEQTKVQELLGRVRAGEDEAFCALADAFHPMMESLVCRSSVPSLDEEEQRQEARLALYHAACTYKPDHGVTFGLYARVCVRNAIVSYLRRHHAQAQSLSPKTLDELLIVDDTDPIGTLIEAEALARLQKKIDGVLSPYERSVFEHYVLGERPAAIAARLGKSEKSVSNAIFRMQSKLRCALDK
ncbi:MAG: sigma-70 family RNA polymerase sigma factor [Clostridia bacterium]|nr:sigma-70 family RNA polymerase sigma factor [Clostridia bacterium]